MSGSKSQDRLVYTVSLFQNDESVFPLKRKSTISLKTAIRIAKQYVNENYMFSDNQVFISYFRESDSQEGYINPDGSASFSGKDWMEA